MVPQSIQNILLIENPQHFLVVLMVKLVALAQSCQLTKDELESIQIIGMI